MSYQKRRETRNHAIVLPITWRIQTKTVFAPNHFIVAGESSIQIIKSRKTIPTCEKLFKNSYFVKKLGNTKAITVPAKIYAMVVGCFKAFIIHRDRRTTQRIREKDKKNWSITHKNIINFF